MATIWGPTASDMQSLSRQIEIRPYTAQCKAEWDAFIEGAKNGYFIFRRDYMEYHADRFSDHSLLFFYKNRLVGALPANRKGDVLYSHEGLTFGGMICGMAMTSALMLDSFAALRDHMQREGLRKLVYKPIPHVFSRQLAQEDLFALTLNGARLTRRDLSSALVIGATRYSDGKKANIAKAAKRGVQVRETGDYRSFMAILAVVLEERHGVKPAHGAAEMELLSSRFPRNIRLFGAYLENSMVAGSVIYEHAPVIHTQYMASTPEGKTAGALDYLISSLITGIYAEYSYLSFGISTIEHGRVVNFGLLESKEAFGARAMVHDWYEMDAEPGTA